MARDTTGEHASAPAGIAVTRSSMPPMDEFVAEIAPLWETHWLTNMGEKHYQLECALRDYLGVRHVSLLTNGHLALECAFEALELPAGGEVITTPFTFASTTHAIVRSGLVPVMCDVRPDSLTLDPNLIEPLITERTVAIVPVHVYGNPCDHRAIEDVAVRHGLKVIYDAAHAFGVSVEGDTPLASWGDASMFSFHATKVFNTVEGGCVAYDAHGLKGRLAQWRNFGIMGPEDVEYVGGNAKMDEVRAAMGLCNLRHLPEKIARRRMVAERYWKHLDDVVGIEVWHPLPGVNPNYAYMPIIIDPARFGATRDDVFHVLGTEGINARKYFYPLVSDYACYCEHFDSSATPIAKQAAEQVLCLPMYAGLDPSDVDRVCEALMKTRG